VKNHKLPPSQKAQVEYLRGRLSIRGPSTLIDALYMVEQSYPSTVQEYQDRKAAVMHDFYVDCSVSEEQIRLDDLHYWNVERQIAYAHPQLIDISDFYPQLGIVTP
jgi:hypothetical protein